MAIDLFEGATAADVSFRRFGIRTRAIERRVTVGTTPTEILENNPRRVFATITNLSADAGAIGLDRQITTTNADFIPAQGGIELAVDEDGEVVAWSWFAVGLVVGTWYVREIVGV